LFQIIRNAEKGRAWVYSPSPLPSPTGEKRIQRKKIIQPHPGPFPSREREIRVRVITREEI
jgi:hypothetical protein